MKRKIAVLGIACILALSMFLSGAIAPFVTNGGIRVSAANDVQTSDGGTEQSMSIQGLPSKQYEVTADIQDTRPDVNNGEFSLVRRVGSRDVLVGLSDFSKYAGSTTGLLEIKTGGTSKQFGLPGTYIYRFYTASEFKPAGKSVHDYVITVNSSVYRIELPTNSPDILPNVVVPSVTAASPIVPIVLPLPKSLYDTKGRDLLGLDDEDTKDDAILALKSAFEGVKTSAEIDAMSSEDLKELVYGRMRITFFGNNTTEYSGATASVFGINDATSRTFVPTKDGGVYYAEYYFQQGDITASFRTNNITVEKANVVRIEKPHTTNDQMIADINKQILFNAKPSMSFIPVGSNFKIGSEMTLPVPTVTVSEDSAIKFDNNTTITNYSFVVVRFHPKSGNTTFRYLDKDGEQIIPGENGHPATINEDYNKIMRINDFKFTPKKVGTYQFIYYTTTIFGVGKNNHSSAPATFEGKTFIKHYPFDNLIIDRDSQAPEIKWTEDFTYDANNQASIDFDDAEDYSKYLPGSTSNSKTVIEKGESLNIPALLGKDNLTASNQLDYKLYLYSYDNGVRDGSTPVWWSSGKYTDVRENGNENGDGWDHTEKFTKITFPTKQSFETGDYLSSTLSGGKGFKDKDVAGKYDLVVRAYDADGNPSSELTYTFEVVDSRELSRPKFNGLFQLGQKEFYEGDTVRFNVANPTDKYTNDVNIEVKYYVSSANGTDIGVAGGAVEIKDDAKKGMTINNGVVSFKLTDEYPDSPGAYVLEKLGLETDHSLQFRIYAVARNYHALVNDINLSAVSDPSTNKFTIGDASSTVHDNTDTANFIPYITAVFDTVAIYKMSYGTAAVITDQIGDYEWKNFLTDDKVAQGEKIYIPALMFSYAADSYFSTITYEVIHKESGTSISASTAQSSENDRPIGGGWQGTIGSTAGTTVDGDADDDRLVLGLDGKDIQEFGTGDVGDINNYDGAVAWENAKQIDNRRFFTSNNAGEHLVVVKATNAGGNVGIFVGSITVKGIPHYSARLINDGVDTMKIGESKSLPAVEVTIDGGKYVSGGLGGAGGAQGYIVTADEMAGADFDPGEANPRQAKVGTYSVTFGSENMNRTTMERNNFVPTVPDRYKFIFSITITDDEEEGYAAGKKPLPSITPSKPLQFELEYYITVNSLENSDIVLDLDSKRYNDLANSQLSIGDTGFDATDVNRYNFFTEMTVDGAEGKTLEMTDDQLINGLIPTSDPSVFEYGRIYIPNELPSLAESVRGLGADFYEKAEAYITVEWSKSKTNIPLLDTRANSATFDHINDTDFAEGLYWFKPQGFVEKDADGKWVPANNANKDAVTVDGEYVVTYRLTYMDTTVTKRFNIAMGDTRQPKITYTGEPGAAENVFEKTYKVGGKMIFVFGKNTFNISGTKNNEFFWTDGYLNDTANNSNVHITVSRDSGTQVKPGLDDDDKYTITFDKNTDPKNWIETHQFTFTEAGTYTIFIQVKSESGVWGNKSFSVKVEEKTPKAQIAPEKIWGIILIVLSVGLLLGVIVYFFATGRKTKFAGNQSKKAVKTDKPDVV